MNVQHERRNGPDRRTSVLSKLDRRQSTSQGANGRPDTTSNRIEIVANQMANLDRVGTGASRGSYGDESPIE